jgi:hypothetical protein
MTPSSAESSGGSAKSPTRTRRATQLGRLAGAAGQVARRADERCNNVPLICLPHKDLASMRRASSCADALRVSDRLVGGASQGGAHHVVGPGAGFRTARWRKT